MTIQPGCNKFYSKSVKNEFEIYLSELIWSDIKPSVHLQTAANWWVTCSKSMGEGIMVTLIGFTWLYVWSGGCHPQGGAMTTVPSLPRMHHCGQRSLVIHQPRNPRLGWKKTTKPLEFHHSDTCVWLRNRRPINSRGWSGSHWCGQSNCKSSSRCEKHCGQRLLTRLTESPR